MADGYATLQRWITQLRELDDLPETIAEAIAPELRDEIEGNIAAARAPDGTPWKPTRDGRPPLRNAAKALDVKATGPTVLAELRGIEARHHYGSVRGGIARPILPSSPPPPPIVALVERVAQEEFRRIMDGV